MPRQVEARSYGSVFDDVAEDYDRHRPSYPDVLVDGVCERAGIARRIGRPIRSSTIACLVVAPRQPRI